MLTRDTHIITPTNLRHIQPLTVEQALSHRPETRREWHLPEIHEGVHALKKSTPLTPLYTPHKRPAYMPELMEQPRKHFCPFRHLLKMHFVHIWQNSHLSDTHIKRIFVVHYAKVHFLKKVFPVPRKYAP